MDFATLIGIIAGYGAVIFAMYHSSHGHLESYISSEGLIVVIAGSIACVCIAMPATALLGGLKAVRKLFVGDNISIPRLIEQIVHFAEVARQEGILALENRTHEIKDLFLKKAIQLAVDGTDPDVIEKVLKCEIEVMAERHKQNKKLFELVAAFGPGLALAATLMGQIAMFRSMGSDQSTIGKALAMALVATLYGTLICNLIAGPPAQKLAARSKDEILAREVILHGILSIQSGNNPRLVQMHLMSYLNVKQQQGILAAQGGA
jgi:chemotaxis protein MotA